MKTENGILIFCGTLYDTHKIARGRNLSTVALKNNCCTFSTKYAACASQTEWNISLILYLVWLVKCTLTQNKRYVGRWYMLSVVRIHILKQVSVTRYLQKSEVGQEYCLMYIFHDILNYLPTLLCFTGM